MIILVLNGRSRGIFHGQGEAKLVGTVGIERHPKKPKSPNIARCFAVSVFIRYTVKGFLRRPEI